MTLLDGILIGIMLVSAVLAMIRGLTREIFSIASWVLAAVATFMFWDDLLPVTRNYVPDENLSLGVTVLGIFLVTLFVVTLVTMKISDFILDSKAGPLDRTLGFMFGAARGLLLMVIGVLFINFFSEPEKQWTWISEAKSKPWLDELGNNLLNMLPEDPEAAIMELRPGDPDRPAGEGDGASVNPAGRNYASEDRNALQRQIQTSQQ